MAPRAATVVIETDAEIPVATGSIDRTGRDTVNALTVRRNLIVPTVPAAGEISKIDGAFSPFLPNKQTRKKWMCLEWPGTG